MEVTRIGVFSHGWWKQACAAVSIESTDLPAVTHSSGNAHAADLAGRIAAGTTATAILAEQPVDLLLDNSGTGMGFIPDPERNGALTPAHEAAGRILCSHFVDPLITAFQGLGWSEVWQALQSPTWIKAIWDQAQVVELQQFGVPNVVHLPMAAPNRPYNVEPLDPRENNPIVSFVGGQNTSYFSSNVNVPTRNLLAGTLANAIRADLPQVSFYEAYHNVYGLGEPITPNDDLNTQINKTAAYFNAKLFLNASLCIRNRDRFVIFLKRKLGDQFHLAGRGWDQAYGLPAAEPFPTTDAYLDHFRRTAINLNLVNGNAETGLNMRHFEITAAGGFMLCYQQPELENCFEVGKECAVFHNESDLLEKIQYYLAHPDERIAIALAGQRRTLSHHLFSHRLRTLLDGIRVDPLPVEYSKTTRWDDIRSLVPSPDVVFDCGANIGQTLETLQDLFPKAEVYCFEPVAAAFSQLQQRCTTLNAHAVNKAVGDRDGKAQINLTTSPECHSLLAFQEGNPCAQWTQVVGQEEVDVCMLDTWCEQNGIDPQRIDLLKLDVQGAELQALYGARKLLTAVKLVFIEVAFVPIYKDIPLFHEIDRFLTECGYRRHGVYPSDQPHNWGDALYAKV